MGWPGLPTPILWCDYLVASGEALAESLEPLESVEIYRSKKLDKITVIEYQIDGILFSYRGAKAFAPLGTHGVLFFLSIREDFIEARRRVCALAVAGAVLPLNKRGLH